MSDTHFILTTHAKERLAQRRVSMSELQRTLSSPDRTKPADKPDSVKFIRNIDQRQIEVVGRFLPQQKQWLILSVWVRGEEDQAPLAWRLITLPFKAVWWLIKTIVTYVVRSSRTS